MVWSSTSTPYCKDCQWWEVRNRRGFCWKLDAPIPGKSRICEEFKHYDGNFRTTCFWCGKRFTIECPDPVKRERGLGCDAFKLKNNENESGNKPNQGHFEG